MYQPPIRMQDFSTERPPRTFLDDIFAVFFDNLISLTKYGLLPAVCISPFVIIERLLSANHAVTFLILIPITYFLTSYFEYAERLVFSRTEPPKWSSAFWLDRTGWKTFGALLLIFYFWVLNCQFIEHLFREGESIGVFIAYLLLMVLPLFALMTRLAFVLPAIVTGNDGTFGEIWRLGRKRTFAIMGSVICVALAFFLILFSIGALLSLIGKIADMSAGWLILFVPVELMYEVLKIAVMAITIAVLYRREGDGPATAESDAGLC